MLLALGMQRSLELICFDPQSARTYPSRAGEHKLMGTAYPAPMLTPCALYPYHLPFTIDYICRTPRSNLPEKRDICHSPNRKHNAIRKSAIGLGGYIATSEFIALSKTSLLRRVARSSGSAYLLRCRTCFHHCHHGLLDPDSRD